MTEIDLSNPLSNNSFCEFFFVKLLPTRPYIYILDFDNYCFEMVM